MSIYEPLGTKTERMSFDQRQKIVCERFVLEENFPDASREKQNIGYYAKNSQTKKLE